MKETGIYTDLDSIFDMRLVVIDKVAKGDLKDVMKGYMDRRSDHFDCIDMDEYDRLYKSRDVTTWIGAPITNIFYMINAFVFSSLNTNVNTPIPTYPTLYVNLYPYKLNEDETRELTKVIAAMTKGLVHVNIINKEVRDLDIPFIKNNLRLMIVYHHEDLLEHIVMMCSSLKLSCGDTELVVPRLVTGTGKMNANKVSTSLFEETEMYFMPFITLNFMDPDLFSIHLKKP